MKNLSFVLGMLILGLACNSLIAQTVWAPQNNPLSNGVGLGKIQFVSATEGWISGSQGNLLHTTDGGTTWNVLIPFPNDIVFSMSDPAITMWWVDQTHGWKINWLGTSFEDAHGAVIYLTIDGGNTWQKKVLSTTTGEIGLQVQFVDANNGWVSIYNLSNGNFKILKSTDGGNNWNQVATSGGIFYFINANQGWAITSVSDNPPYKILHTTDGGANWSIQYTDNSQGSFNSIQFTDLNNGWVVGNKGKILKTTNSGINWTPITNTGITPESNSKCVFFLNANTGWITNAEPSWPNHTILHTTNGGISWTNQEPNFLNGSMFSIFFWDGNTGWFTGERCVQNCYGPDELKVWTGLIHHTSNGGTTKVEEYLTNNQITIYPNPNNGAFYINYKNVSTKKVVEIYNVFGEKVYETSDFNHQTSNEINLSKSPKGIYFVKINDGGVIYTEKIVIR